MGGASSCALFRWRQDDPMTYRAYVFITHQTCVCVSTGLQLRRYEVPGTAARERQFMHDPRAPWRLGSGAGERIAGVSAPQPGTVAALYSRPYIAGLAAASRGRLAKVSTTHGRIVRGTHISATERREHRCVPKIRFVAGVRRASTILQADTAAAAGKFFLTMNMHMFHTPYLEPLPFYLFPHPTAGLPPVEPRP